MKYTATDCELNCVQTQSPGIGQIPSQPLKNKLPSSGEKVIHYVRPLSSFLFNPPGPTPCKNWFGVIIEFPYSCGLEHVVDYSTAPS